MEGGFVRLRTLARGLGLILLASAFIIAGWAKIDHPYEFFEQVLQYELIDPSLSLCVAVVLPYLEIACGAALILRVFLGGALLCTIALTVMFVVAQLIVIVREMSVTCACFGATSETVGWLTVTRTSALAALGAWLFYLWLRDAHGTAAADVYRQLGGDAS